MNQPSFSRRQSWKRIFSWLPDLRLPAGLVLLYLSLIQLTVENWVAGVFFGFCGAGSLWWLARRWQYRLIGPLFYYELIRLARGGWTTWLRCGYGLVLLTALWLKHDEWLRQTGGVDFPADQARLAEQFMMTIFIVQNLSGILLMSLYACGTIVDECQMGTLENLLICQLHDHEIVVGKLFARLVTVASILLTGLPVLALIQIWGGVDIRMLAGGFASTLATLFLIGCISIFCSSNSQSRVFAFIGSQGLYWMFSAGVCIPLVGFAASPFFFLQELESRLRGTELMWTVLDLLMSDPAVASQEVVTLQMIGGFVLGQVLLAILFLRGAVRLLRYPLLQRAPLPVLAQERVQVKNKAAFRAGEKVVNRKKSTEHIVERAGLTAANPPVPNSEGRRILPSIFYHPLWWWELRTSPGSPKDVIVGFSVAWLVVAFVYGVAVFVLLSFTQVGGDFSDETVHGLNIGLRAVIVLTAGLACCTTGFSATIALSKQRAKRTLDNLFLLPEDWTRIFVIKYLAILWKCSWPLFCLALYWTVAALTPALHIAAVFLLTVAVAVHVLFFASLGMWLSLVCKTGMRATLTMGCVMLAVTAGSWLFLPEAIRISINPILTWWELGFSWRESSHGVDFELTRFYMAKIGVCIYAFAAALFWWLALRRFYAEPSRHR